MKLFFIAALSLMSFHSVFAQSSLANSSLFHRAVIGGKLATTNSKSWRSVVRYGVIKNDDKSYSCTGTFIDYDLLLTATHCLKGFTSFTYIDFFEGSEVKQTIWLTKEQAPRVYLNPQYLASARHYSQDYAFVQFPSPLLPSGYRPMRTVDSNDLRDFDELVDKNVFMIGASYNQMGGLAFARGTVEFLEGSVAWVKGRNAKEGICGGDSGGPLVIDNGRELVLVGVLAQYNIRYNERSGDNCTEGGGYALYSGEVSQRLRQFRSQTNL